jgi:hypothetical protein
MVFVETWPGYRRGHNGFEVRSHSYHSVRLALPSWQLTPVSYPCVRLVGSSSQKFSHFFSHLFHIMKITGSVGFYLYINVVRSPRFLKDGTHSTV